MKGTALIVTALVLVSLGGKTDGSRTIHFRCKRPGQITVTFDDGPVGNNTLTALRVLEENEVPGTFFINGRQIRPNYSKRDENIKALKALAKSEFATIAHHTYDHVNALTQKWDSFDQYFEEQIESETALVEDILGHDVMEDFLRPPFLAYNLSAFENLRRMRTMTVVGESLNPRDWDSTLSQQDLIDSLVAVLSAADPAQDSFISLHHPKSQTPQVIYDYLTYYIHFARQRGLRFVSLKTCLGM